MIGIVDYGLGNIHAFATIYKRLNIPCAIVKDKDDLNRATKLILPGVGAFDWAMKRLTGSGLRPALDEAVLERNVPVLGVCVGMQMMASTSEEGELEGLGWIPGRVKRLGDTGQGRQLPLPHMGWNDVTPRVGDGLFHDLEDRARFYFLHSYYFCPDDSTSVLADTDYCGTFASSTSADNKFGVQFHPEKSHEFGIKLLRNFAEITPHE